MQPRCAVAACPRGCATATVVFGRAAGLHFRICPWWFVLRDDDARLFLEIHRRSIRGLAAQHYPADIIDAWAGSVTDESIRRFLENPDYEIRLLAERDGQPVGLGALVVDNTELRPCYVVREAARTGVGSALVKEMERIARDHGLTHLELHASVNAEPFYTALGYDALELEDHVLRSGLRIAALKMRKNLKS